MKKILSIITVTFNCENIIEQTIESVIRQSFTDYEYIFVDGGSKDRTVEKIKQCVENKINDFKIISEPDKGIYDAMNKGIRLSEADYVLFLNAGDCLKDNVLSGAFADLDISDETLPILYGDSTNIYINSKKEQLAKEYIAPCDREHFDGIGSGMCGLRHQAMLIPKYVFDEVGFYDLRFPISADWEHMISCMEKNVPFKHIIINFCDYKMDGVSTKPNLKERHLIRKKHHMYRGVDWRYMREALSIQNIVKTFWGQTKYNDLLFFYQKHK